MGLTCTFPFSLTVPLPFVHALKGSFEIAGCRGTLKCGYCALSTVQSFDTSYREVVLILRGGSLRSNIKHVVPCSV